MSNTPTIPAEPTTTPPAEPTPPADAWTDGQPFDATRAKRLIDHQRGIEQSQKGEIGRLRDAVRALSTGGQLSVANQATIDAALPGDDTLSAVAAILGAEIGPDGIVNPASVVDAATQARLSGELYGIMAEAHADPKLTRAVLNDQRSLVGIDLGDGLHDRLTNIVADAMKAHPQLRRNQGPVATITPMPGGSGGSTPFITRESLKYLDAETVNKLRMSGQLEHLNVGKG